MRIAFVIYYCANYQPLADVVLPRIQSYCNRHGYILIVQCDGYGDGAIGLQKMHFLRDLLRKNAFEVALVTDLDIVITNHTRRIEDFFDNSGDYFVTKDINGINTGSFIIRNTIWSWGFIEYVIAAGGTNEQDVMKQRGFSRCS